MRKKKYISERLKFEMTKEEIRVDTPFTERIGDAVAFAIRAAGVALVMAATPAIVMALRGMA
ncbi:hypothetical protein [Chitinilyticum aquatile]|uniref:hypothetical protein n=1 Tax=Chitinilyticum aquatile TaxID=362520 RepID=UPI00048F217C|nr:hypothetical protein [Chitinilyticum aquatile]